MRKTQAKTKQLKWWAKFYLGMFDGSVGEVWFRWVEWVLVTGALYAAGNIAKSPALTGFAYFSGVLTFFYALDKIEIASKSFATNATKFQPLFRITAILILIIAQLGAVLAISNA